MKLFDEDHLKKSLKALTWREYLNECGKINLEDWVFRGQSYQHQHCQKCKESTLKITLKSGFERALTSCDIPFSKAPEIEGFMIREFRRKYEGADSQMVIEDTLYCLSLMQHYGCPTRLLDCTYSPYIAALFAVEDMSIDQETKREAVIFRFKHKWINESARLNIANDDLFDLRFHDESITDQSFVPLYMKQKPGFIVAETPHLLHRRLSIQKGTFIIQGDIKKTMMENIESMNDWQSEGNIVLYKLKIDTRDDLRDVYADLRLMNITRESLFPGLDGFARSLKQNLYWYQDLKTTKDKVNPFGGGIS